MNAPRGPRQARSTYHPDEQQVGRVEIEVRAELSGDSEGVGERILETRAMKLDRRQAGEAMVGGAQPGMLAGEDEARGHTRRRKSMGEWCKLDRFGTSADDERNKISAQRSP